MVCLKVLESETTRDSKLKKKMGICKVAKDKQPNQSNMKKTVYKFVFSLMLLAAPVFVGCSESDGPEDPAAPKTEFRLTADDLNTHLPDIDNHETGNEYMMGPDGGNYYLVEIGPGKSKVVNYFYTAIYEIPARGGEYTIYSATLANLRRVSVITGIPEEMISDKSMSTMRRNYGLLVTDDEFGNPSYSFSSAFLNENLEIADTNLGEVTTYDLDADTPWYTYRFPENHTGQYRAFVLYAYHLWRMAFWEILAPDSKPVPTLTPIIILQYPE